jgi:choline kinase
MKAVILSAGQGKRLFPLTVDNPKCLMNIAGRPLIEWQIDELGKCGIERIIVVTGYRADKVAMRLRRSYNSRRVATLYNPAYSWSDNLFSCWVAREAMNEEFVLINGDTLFEADVLRGLMESPCRPLTVATHQKRNYDADDMKVALDGDRLLGIGKDLPIENVNGESIGMLLFRGKGPAIFRQAIEKALHNPSAVKKWYLSVIDELARSMPVWSFSTQDLRWCEVDFPADLKEARKVVGALAAAREHQTGSDSVFQQNEYAWG